MKSFLKNMFSQQEKDLQHGKEFQGGPLFLTTHGLNFYIEKIIKEAQEYICIVSPYVKLHARLEELLLERKRDGIKIYIVCRIQDTKTTLSHIANEVRDRKNLHAKCFLSENAAIVGSLNLYDFSQINNDEMGFYCSKVDVPSLFNSIHDEVRRIYSVSCLIEKNLEESNTTLELSTSHTVQKLEEGKKYSFHSLDAFFDFDYKKPSGIKATKSGDIALFINKTTKYNNEEVNGVIYYQGQNTGQGAQQLIFGNKQLYAAYNEPSIRIFVFRAYVYEGEYCICKKPYKESDKWIFPLSKKA